MLPPRAINSILYDQFVTELKLHLAHDMLLFAFFAFIDGQSLTLYMSIVSIRI